MDADHHHHHDNIQCGKFVTNGLTDRRTDNEPILGVGLKQHLNLCAVKLWVRHGTKANPDIPDLEQNLFLQ